MSESTPKERLRQIAQRLAGVFAAATPIDHVMAIREWDRHSVQDAGWLLQRERGLRARLQDILRKNAALEERVRSFEHGREKSGLRSPVVRAPSQVIKPEDEALRAEMRQLSKELALESAMDDAFEIEDEFSDWYETVD